MVNRLGYLAAFSLPILVVISAYLGRWYFALPIIFVFGILTLFDHILGLDTHNLSEDNSIKISDDYYYRFLTYCWTYCQVAFIIWGAYFVASGNISDTFQWVSFTLSSSLVTGGIGITVAHELGHKKSRIEKLYSKLLLMTVCYMHFYVEHNRGHHVHVATPQDPATSRKNENFYFFWIRCVTESYKHAWQLENESMQRKGLPKFHISNPMIWFTILPFLFCLLLTILFSLLLNSIAWQVPLYFFTQSLLAFTMLELVDYIEHYGIVRKLKADGKYERVNPLHSWNSSHMLSNYFLFQLQRHSDHHHNAIKRYQVLNHYEESPQLPLGYPTMILIALVPPLWFKMMNPLLEGWNDRIYNPIAKAA